MANKAKSGSEANRRRFDRRDTAIEARLEHAGQFHAGHIDNLSLTGFLFNPPVSLPPDTKVKLWLANRSNALAATIVGTSERGLHGRMHVGAPKLAQLSVDVDDVALLLINATRPPESTPAQAAKQKAIKKSAPKKALKKKPAAKKAAPKKVATKKKTAKQPRR